LKRGKTDLWKNGIPSSIWMVSTSSSNGWREVLKDLQKRGATDVLLGAFDGLPGLEETFREIYPKADVQHCIFHKVRATFPKIRVTDKTEFLDDLKQVTPQWMETLHAPSLTDLRTNGVSNTLRK
jgi:transposase-like protein